MSILILEEKIFPSAVGKHAFNVEHHSILKDAIYKLQEVYTLDNDDFHFDYAIDIPIQSKDTDSVSAKTFKDAYDEERILELIEDHEIIISLGSRLCEKLLGKKLSKAKNKVHKLGDKIIIPGYSSFYMYKNKISPNSLFSLAYSIFSGDYLDRDLPEYEIVTTLERLNNIIDYAKITNVVCFDFETCNYKTGNHTNFSSKDTVATVLSLSFQPGYSYVIPIHHKDWDWGEDYDKIIQLLNLLFNDPTTTKIAHNIKFDLHFLKKYNISIRGRLVDTMLMSHILWEHRKHGLKELIKEYFPFWAGYEEGVDYTGPLEQLSKYAGIDTDITLRLFYIFEYQLLVPGNEKLYILLRNLQMPAVLALQDIEFRGCKLDRDLIVRSIKKAENLLSKKKIELNSYSEVVNYVFNVNHIEVNKKINELQDKIKIRLEKYGENDRYVEKYREQVRELKTNAIQLYTEVNFNSPKQLSGLLYDGFCFKVPVENGLEKRSTAKNFLNEIEHPFINTLLAYRSISKMLSTYYKGLLEKLDVNDNVHGSFLLHGTITGRLSSRDPNLQNIPSRLSFDDEDARWALKQVKKFFIPISEDYYVIQADYSQAELRVIANDSLDPTMVQAYINNEDLHEKTAANIANLSLEDFRKLPKSEYKKLRTKAKSAIFGWVYKSSIDGYKSFAKNTYNIILSDSEAQKHKDAVFKTYSTLNKWHHTVEMRAKKQGFVETMFGRRRRFLNINNSTNQSLINKDIRDAINNPIQGSAGELTIFCISLLYHRLPEDCKIWCTVHDSIFFYIPKNKLYYLKIINEICENPPLFDYFGLRPSDYPVSMKMDYEISDKSWGDMEEIGDFQDVKALLSEGDDFPNYFEDGLESTF